MRGGYIDGAQTGIYVPCPSSNDINESNVILEFGATIKNCTDGVYIGKGGTLQNTLDYGLVRMRCAKLLDNDTGIRGVDILLDIDGCDLAGSSCMPNTFKRGLGLHHFNIKYFDRDETVIRATNNYWSGDYPVGQVPGINYILDRANSISGCNASGSASSLTLNWSDYLTAPPINCTNMVPLPDGPKPTVDVVMFTGTDYECNIPLAGNKRVDKEYTDALWYLTNDQNSNALARFQAVAGIPNSTRDAASSTCRHDIDVARVFAYALNTNSVNTNGENGFQGKTSITELEAFPNPASESVRLVFGQPVFIVEVHDVLGKRYFSGEIEDGAALSVRNWPAGLYWLTATDEETKERSTIKLVVK